MRYKGMPFVPSDLGPVQSGSGPGPMGPRVWFLPYAMFTTNLQGLILELPFMTNDLPQ